MNRYNPTNDYKEMERTEYRLICGEIIPAHAENTKIRTLLWDSLPTWLAVGLPGPGLLQNTGHTMPTLLSPAPSTELGMWVALDNDVFNE